MAGGVRPSWPRKPTRSRSWITNLLWFSLGLPGRFSDWCDEVVAALAARLGGTVVLDRWPSRAGMLGYEAPSQVSDRLARVAIASDAAHLVIGARQPDHGLYRALSDTQTRFVLAIDHPRVAVADLLETAGGDTVPVVRAVANSCALLTPYAGLPGVLALSGDAACVDPIATVLSIARHLRSDSSEGAARAVVHGLGSPREEESVGDRVSPARIPAAAAKTVGGALAGFEEHFAGTGLGRLVWNRDLFLTVDPQLNIARVLDLAGGVRTMVHGPYLHLPAGYWTASVHFGVSHEAAQFPIQIEICTDRQLAAVTVQPQTAGIHVADLGFSLSEPGTNAVVLRVTVLEAEAYGRFAFGHVVLTPAGLRHPEEGVEWQEEFRASADL